MTRGRQPCIWHAILNIELPTVETEQAFLSLEATGRFQTFLETTLKITVDAQPYYPRAITGVSVQL